MIMICSAVVLIESSKSSSSKKIKNRVGREGERVFKEKSRERELQRGKLSLDHV